MRGAAVYAYVTTPEETVGEAIDRLCAEISEPSFSPLLRRSIRRRPCPPMRAVRAEMTRAAFMAQLLINVTRDHD
jgi:hypothetical protein